jgi:hypothetical protein
MSLTKLSLAGNDQIIQNSPRPGIIKLFPARESLVTDIPAGDLFLQCTNHYNLLFGSFGEGEGGDVC